MRTLIAISLISLLIFSSCDLKEEEPVESSLNGTAASITVTKPNGGESIMEGSSYNVQWTATGVTLISIQFSFDNGSSWYLIADSVENKGVYSWFPVPNLVSNQCKIRVSSNDGSGADESDQSFSIIKNSSQSLKMVAPAGGENWEGGSAKEIKWFSSGLDSVKIEYTTDNGNHWNFIAVDKKNTGIYYWDPLPNTPSTLTKVRIMDASDGYPSTESPATFNILPEPKLRVIRPNGGETLLSAGTRKIEWISENIENVKIAYSTDNGAKWNTIIESTPSIGFYTWENIPNLVSQNCKIKVYDAKDSQPNDESDSVFTITNQITQIVEVEAPNGGERWQAGTAQNITWNSSGVPQVKIECTTNNGIEWNLIIDQLPNTGAYEWNVPNSLSTQCLVRISDSQDGNPVDQSNSRFSIVQKPELRIISPNGGEVWTAGQIDTIKWYSEGIENVQIGYTSNNGVDWIELVGSTESDGSYPASFTVPSSQYKIIIRDATTNSPVDYSDGVFTVTDQPTIEVITPNGGEKWYADSRDNIRWTSANIEEVKIEYTTNNGANWRTIVERTPSNGVYSWNIPPNHISSELCRVRISDANDNIPSDISDDNFSIINNTDPGQPIQLITVTKPNGGESYPAGSRQYITWTASGITNVKIEYTTNNGIKWIPIVNSTPSTGFYTWDLVDSNKVPIVATTTTNCKIRISDATDGAPSDDSDQFFTIEPEPYVTVFVPNGGESWFSGSSQDIRWISENVANVKIEYSTDAGANWTTIVNSTPSIGIYRWNSIPVHFSLQCRIRISDVIDGSPFDISNSNFTITSQVVKSLQITFPNGGEDLEAGTKQNITWSSSGIEKVKIELTTNKGSNWTILADSVSGGAFEWEISENVNSPQCQIRITDIEDIKISDVSDGSFTISPRKWIIVTGPQTKVYKSDEPVTITWQSGGIQYVGIKYTATNGIADISNPAYTVLADKVGATSGSYTTYFSRPSDKYFVVVYNADVGANGTPSNNSPGFTIIKAETPEIKVVKPNGGEEWYAGANDNIQWTSTNVENVKIEYSTNSGASWTLITNNTPSNGVYAWNPIPGVFSRQCRIKVSNVADGSLSDVSDSNFAILYGNQMVTVTSPNGGESWAAGSRQNITWTASGINNVRIEYTTNNGINWLPIVDSTPSDGFYTWENIPSSASTNCKIRISDAVDLAPSDESDEFFVISPEPSIKVVIPNGGESWQNGTSQEIRWTSQSVANVKIEYTTNGGANWTTIINSVESKGYYNWNPIPNLNSLQCKIRISDANDGTPYDLSDENFQISNQVIKSITIISPNGGEDFEAGTVQNISWNSSGINLVKIELSTNNGTNWVLLANNLENTGGYQWQINNQLNVPKALIKVSDVSDGTTSDVCDGTFKISPVKSINVIYPTSGLVFRAGTPVTVEWESSGLEKVNIRYTTTNGIGSINEPAFYVIATNIGNSGSYPISNGFSIPSDRYYIEVYYTEGDRQWSSKSGNFKVTPQVYPTITLKQPNGGEEFLTSDPQNTYSHEIIWESTEVENVKIEYSLNGGATWNTIVQNLQSSGIYTWNMPQDVAFRSENARIRISNTEDSSMYDMSDEVFAIHPQNKLIRILYPNGLEGEAEVLEPESPDDPVPAMTWHSAGVYNVKVEMSFDNGVSWTVLAASMQSTGALGFTFPSPDDIPYYPPSTNARIRVTDVSTDAGPNPISDISDYTFYYRVKKQE